MPHIWVGDIGRVTTIVLSACSYLHSTVNGDLHISVSVLRAVGGSFVNHKHSSGV